MRAFKRYEAINNSCQYAATSASLNGSRHMYNKQMNIDVAVDSLRALK